MSARQASLTTPLKPRRKSLMGRNWSRVDLLEQDRWWTDRRGNVHDVTKIDGDYRRMLLAYFLQNAKRFKRLHLMRGLFGGVGPYADEAEAVAGLETFSQDAGEWMMERPLVRALLREYGLEASA